MLAIAHRLLLDLELSIEEDFLLFIFDDETGLGDRVAVVSLVLLLIPLLVGCLGVGFAIEDHLLPGFKSLENVEHILVLWVMGLRRTHESTIAEAVVFECPLVFFSHAEGLQAPLVLQFKTCFGRTILY